MNAQIPYDPQILVSFVNTALRNEYRNLDDLCAGLEIDKEELIRKLEKIEYVYDASANKFV